MLSVWVASIGRGIGCLPMLRWYFGLKGRYLIGSVVSQLKDGRGMTGG